MTESHGGSAWFRGAKLVVKAAAAFVVLWAVLAALFAWQLRTVRDVTRYPELRNDWNPELVGHFPEAIPAGAVGTSLSMFPGFLQGGAHLQLRVELPGPEVEREEVRVAQAAVHVHRPGETEERGASIPLPPFYTGADDPGAGFPDDFVLYFVVAHPGESSPWNHGRTAGIAVSRQRSELVYWAESW